MRGVLRALELFLEAPVGVVAHEDAEAIAVEGHGQARPRGELLEQGEIAVQVFGGSEVQRQDGARRVVDGPEEESGRPVPSQSNWLPSMSTRLPMAGTLTASTGPG